MISLHLLWSILFIFVCFLLNELNSKLTYFLKEVMIYACLKKAENGTEEFMYQFFIQPDSVKEKEVWITDLQDYIFQFQKRRRR